MRQLLHAAVGCNIAWGIIDAVMYVMNCMVQRSGKARLVRAVQSAPNRTAALDIIREGVEPSFEPLAGAGTVRRCTNPSCSMSPMPETAKTRVTKEDLYGAFACFWLVFISCLPAAVPFLLFSNPLRALRVSNFLLIGMLFVVGQKWAQYANTNRLLAGLAMVAIGLALVGVAVLLGG